MNEAELKNNLKSLVTALATDNIHKAEQDLHNVLQAKMKAIIAAKHTSEAAPKSKE